MLGIMSTTQAVGYYSAAYRLVYFVQTFAGLYATVLLPRVARSRTEEAQATNTVVVRSVSAALTVAGGLIGVVAPLSAEIMVLLFGPAFRPAAPVLAPLVVASAALVASMTLGHAALGLHYDKFYAKAAWTAAGANGLLNLYAIPRWSFYGAAVVTLVTEIGLATAFVVRLWNEGVSAALNARKLAGFLVHVLASAAVGRLVIGLSGNVARRARRLSSHMACTRAAPRRGFPRRPERAHERAEGMTSITASARGLPSSHSSAPQRSSWDSSWSCVPRSPPGFLGWGWWSSWAV